MTEEQLQTTYDNIIKGLQTYFTQSKLNRVVVGVSGGVDSSLTLKLAVDALGPEKVTAISMPENGVTASENVVHAKKLAEALGVKYYQQAINQFLLTFAQVPWKGNTLATQNTKARIRAVLLYNYANTEHALVLGTSNKSEILLGYGTKYGDLAADVEVIGDLFKTEVIELADFVGLPPEISHKTPSAELFPGQTDESEIGATYSEMDPVLRRIDTGMDALIERGMSAALIHNIFKRYENNRHKSQMPPVIKAKKTTESKTTSSKIEKKKKSVTTDQNSTPNQNPSTSEKIHSHKKNPKKTVKTVIDQEFTADSEPHSQQNTPAQNSNVDSRQTSLTD